MKVIRNLLESGGLPSRTAATIGNFDGVHAAHHELFQRVTARARALGIASAALTFDPHPARILHPETAPALLTPLPQRIRLIEREGLDLLVILPFTAELSRLTPAEFVLRILVERLHAVTISVGVNFRFGHGKAGDSTVLAELGRREGFQVETLPFLEVRGQRVSSTRIRELLAAGAVGLAGRLLGRPYAVGGSVASGLGIGRLQTVPTLNLAPTEQLLPKNGVYITRTLAGKTRFESVTNVGRKPTFGNHPLTVESFLLNFEGRLEINEIEIEFLRRLRDEVKFPNVHALKSQINKDVARAVKYFRLLRLVRQGQVRGLVQ